ncbi:MAG: nucleoside kinase [Bacillota bacterium]|jgi:uridine kinase
MIKNYVEVDLVTGTPNSETTTKIQVPLGAKLKDFAPQPNGIGPSVVAAFVNNMLKDLNYPIYCDSRIQWLDYTHNFGNKIYKYSLSLLLFVACKELYPEHELKVLHSLRNGRYCEMRGGKALRETDFAKIEQKMHELVQADLPIKKDYLTRADALKYYRDIGYDLMAENLEMQKGHNIPVYTLRGHVQYMYSKVVPSTKYLSNFKIEAFDDGFIIREPRSFNMAVCADNEDPDRFAFPKSLQDSLKTYDEWGQILGVQNVADINRAVENDDFKNLIIMAETMQQRAMQKIADSIYADFPKVKVVLIAGPSSSGKTSFCNRMAIEFRSLGLKPIVLSMDNYFVDRAKTPLGADGKPDFECVEAVDLPYFNQQLLQMINGEHVEMPIYDFPSGTRSQRTIPVDLTEKHILLIEGIHGINEKLTAAIPSENKRKIYISCLTQLNLDNLTPISSGDNRELRRLIRDVQFRSAPAEKTLLGWRKVRAGEEKNIFPFQESADYYFNSSLIYEFNVLRPALEEHLMAVPMESHAYAEAVRLLRLIRQFRPVAPNLVPAYSLLQEFLGGSCFEL